MTRPFLGAGIFFSVLVLAGCAGPMGQREAENRAGRSLARFCHQTPCGPTHLLKAQKIKNRWLVDFEGPRQKFTVMVENDGNSKVTVWNK